MKPSECNSIGDVLSLEYSHYSAGKWDMLIQHDGAVILTEQRVGEQPTAKITIPRRSFLKMLRWYEADQEK